MAVQELERHPWSGNVRELRNAVERLLLLADGEVDETLVRETLPAAVSQRGNGFSGSGPLASRVETFERETILAELERTHHNMSETAKTLGLERSHLYKKCTQLGIRVKELRRSDE
jgi:DNA-binding NtrC family response regulator